MLMERVRQSETTAGHVSPTTGGEELHLNCILYSLDNGITCLLKE